MIDTNTPEGMWFVRLSQALNDRRVGRLNGRRFNRQGMRSQHVRPGLDMLEDYRRGDPPLRPDVHSGWKPYIRQFIRMGRLNQADLLISSTSNRLQLRGFRTSAAGDELGDVEARKIMRANGLKTVAREVHEMALCMGESYLLVTPRGDGQPALITAEDPRQMIVAHDPATGAPLAGLKMFRDDWDSADIAYLYLPGLVRKATRGGASSLTGGAYRFDRDGWTFDDNADQDVPGGEFPVVTFRNRYGVGEFENHLDTLDRINDKIFDEWWIAKIQAFRQRAVKNLPETKETLGEDGRLKEVPVAEDEYDDMFTASPDEMWQVPADVEFWESTPVDLTPITTSIEKDRARLAAATSTLLPTIVPDAANGSAEGASLQREENTFKCEDRRDRFDPAWARTMSLAFLFQGDTARADLAQLEGMWAPIVRYSLVEQGSASAQAVATLPLDVIRRDIWQYDPAEVQEMHTLDGQDILRQPAQVPVPAASPAPSQPPSPTPGVTGAGQQPAAS